MIRKFGGTTGVDIQPQGLDLGLGGSNIKSIQRGSIQPWNNTTTTSFDVSISAVDLTKAIVIVRPAYGYVYAGDDVTCATFNSSTSINFSRGKCIHASQSIIYWEVIEFNNVKSLQRGSTTGSGYSTAKIVTISTIDPLKSTVYLSQISAAINATSHQESISGCDITSPTTLAIYGASGDTINWQTIEFN